MIVTLTANPSIDRTISLPGPLVRGSVARSGEVTDQPGGKGVNVARVVAAAEAPTRAVLPADSADPLVRSLDDLGVKITAVPRGSGSRVNIALTEPDGTTTKVNSPGAPLPDESRRALLAALSDLAGATDWLVLSGSLPLGVDEDWYAEAVRTLRPTGARIAVDASDGPLLALAERFPQCAPNLLKPNAEELAQLAGADARRLESAAAAGDAGPAVRAGRALLDCGVEAVLITLGAAGAVLVAGSGAWHGRPPAITPQSTVGAGDSSLAGYLLAHSAGAEPAQRLRRAIAYGSAAAALPGTTLPTPADAAPLADRIRVDPAPTGSPSTAPPSPS